MNDECVSRSAPRHGFTELLVTLEADRDGAHIEEWMIDYLADGVAHTLRVDWEMLLCGTETAEHC